jgi:hypothetical protein
MFWYGLTNEDLTISKFKFETFYWRYQKIKIFLFERLRGTSN